MWVTLEKTPLGEPGIVWSSDKAWGNRNDTIGTVHQYADGRRFASGSFHGFNITHWHPLPKPPKVKQT